MINQINNTIVTATSPQARKTWNQKMAFGRAVDWFSRYGAKTFDESFLSDFESDIPLTPSGRAIYDFFTKTGYSIDNPELDYDANLGIISLSLNYSKGGKNGKWKKRIALPVVPGDASTDFQVSDIIWKRLTPRPNKDSLVGLLAEESKGIQQFSLSSPHYALEVDEDPGSVIYGDHGPFKPLTICGFTDSKTLIPLLVHYLVLSKEQVEEQKAKASREEPIYCFEVNRTETPNYNFASIVRDILEFEKEA